DGIRHSWGSAMVEAPRGPSNHGEADLAIDPSGRGCLVELARRRHHSRGPVHDPRGIGADTDEAEPELDVSLEILDAPQEDARLFAGRPGTLNDQAQSVFVDGAREIARDPEAVAQVRGPDEKLVDAIDRGDLGRIPNGQRVFDL